MGITPVITLYPDYNDWDLVLFQSLSGLLWMIDEDNFNQLRTLHRERLQAEIPDAIFVDAWKDFTHMGDGLHPSYNTSKKAAKKIAQAIITHDNDNIVNKSKAEYRAEIIATGAAVNSAVSITFDPDGKMLLLDAIGNNIFTIDPNNGQTLATTSLDGYGAAGDLAFDKNGAMYYSHPYAGEVWKKSRDGIYTLLWRFPDHIIDGIAVNAEGRVFTASADGSKQLWELDPNGINPPQVVAEMGGLDAFGFGLDGYLYGPDFYNGTGNLYKINVDTGEVFVLSTGFSAPIAAKVNKEGDLHVLDYGASVMYKVDRSTGEQIVIANVPAGSDNFDFSPDGEIFVANLTDTFVYKIDKSGTVKQITEPNFAVPGGIFVHTDNAGTETIWTGTGWSMRAFNTDGAIEKTLDLATGIIPPFSLAGDGENLILSCWYLNLVQTFNPITKTASETYADFATPLNAIRFQGNIIAAELGTGSVVRAGDHEPYIEGLKIPVGLATDDQVLYVGDWETGIIWKAVENGIRLNPPVILASGLSKPEGMTIDHDGSLLVMETGARRLLRIIPETGKLSIVAKNLEIGLKAPEHNPEPWMAVSGVSVSTTGNIYMTGDVGNRIYKITRSSD
ncbi:MAG: hypothetical protein QM504_18400 [Pseudomonadota bacterium]